MRSLIAALRTLVLPFGATSGRRIILDGVVGEISVYNTAGDLVLTVGGSTGPGVISFHDPSERLPASIYVYHSPVFQQKLMLQIVGPNLGIQKSAFLYLIGSDVGGDGPIAAFDSTGSNSYFVSSMDTALINNIQAHKIDGQIQDGVLPTAEGWVAPTVHVNLTHIAGSVDILYRKTALNTVQIIGNMKATGGAIGANSTIFTLPAGYQPISGNFAGYGSINQVTHCNVDVVAGTGVVRNRVAIALNDLFYINLEFPII